ncbi:hypothetical protein, partial [Salmonella enterica]|uniref:hypothetical protein n=1 Tax=Salmonella enterica TaxID=28901 RepID=UPI0020C27166
APSRLALVHLILPFPSFLTRRDGRRDTTLTSDLPDCQSLLGSFGDGVSPSKNSDAEPGHP